MTIDQILITFIQNVLGLIFGFLQDLFDLLSNLFGNFA